MYTLFSKSVLRLVLAALVGLLVFVHLPPARAEKVGLGQAHPTQSGSRVFLPLVVTPWHDPLTAADCNEQYRFLTKESYPNGTSIYAVGKQRLFSPGLIRQLNSKILDANDKIHTSGSGSQVCLNQSIVSTIYRNPDLPYQPGDEDNLTADNKFRVDWKTLDQNPFLQPTGVDSKRKFFVGVSEETVQTLASVTKAGSSAELPTAGMYEITAATRIGRFFGWLNAGMLLAEFAKRVYDLNDMSLDDAHIIDLPDGSHYLPQTRVNENTTIYLRWYRTGFEATAQTFSIDQIIGLLFKDDLETNDMGWVLTRSLQNGKGVPLNIDEFFLLAPMLKELTDVSPSPTDDELEQQLRDLLDEIDNIDLDPPNPPGGGGNGTCRPIAKEVLKKAEWYHVALQATRKSQFPATSVDVSKAWLKSVLRGSEVYTDYYETTPPGKQMSRGQLQVFTTHDGEFLIETRCIAHPTGLLHFFSPYGGCNLSGGISGPGYCPADYKRLNNRGTQIFTFP